MPKRAVNPSRAESETGGGRLESSTTRMTLTKEKAVPSSCGRKAANSRARVVTRNFNLGELANWVLQLRETERETREDCGRAFNS